MPARRVPAPWAGLPVTPARVRWRVRRGGRTIRPWHTPVDFKHRPVAQGGVPADLRARHTAEPPRQTGPLPLLPRPHLGHDAASRTADTGSRWKPSTSAATTAACTFPLRSRQQHLKQFDRAARAGSPANSGRTSEVERGEHGCVVGAWFALARVRVVFDRGHPLLPRLARTVTWSALSASSAAHLLRAWSLPICTGNSPAGGTVGSRPGRAAPVGS